MPSSLPARAASRPRQLLRHWPLIALGGWTALWFAIMAPAGGIAWHFFVAGARLLASGLYGPYYHAPGGLHLYANYPWLQIGPLAFAAAEVITRLGPDHGLVAGQLIMTALGLVALLAIRDIALTVRPELARSRAQVTAFVAGGGVFMIA